ncbi:MAG: tRNA (guanosine(37)-N1)-methyltransferase TrmD [Kouleothrix sp.]
MQFDILTLFPSMFAGPLTESILKRATQAGTIGIALHDIRAYAADKHHTADDAPYGGGAGMVMKAEPVAAAIRAVVGSAAQATPPAEGQRTLTILMTPAGERFSQRVAHELAGYDRLVLVCGHYEGVDERVCEALIDRELSIGDYVLTGGELAAMVLVDAVARLVPGVIDVESIDEESHSGGLLEYPHYTRPAVWEGRDVPVVLLSGHHGQVAQWRRQQQLRRTYQRRPDLLISAELTPADRSFLQSLGWLPNKVNELA